MAAKFMLTVSENLLLEILVRLTDARSAIQCTTVCKRWFSLISSDQFLRKFDQHNNSNNHSTFLITSDEISGVLSLTSGEGVNYHSAPNEYPEFIPWHARRAVLRATAGSNLLLVCNEISNFTMEFCVCSPRTEQWVRIPEPGPFTPFSRFGLVSEPRKGRGARGFRVVMINDHPALTREDRYQFWARVFCSRTGRWGELERFNVREEGPVGPATSVGDGIACDGVVFFPLRSSGGEIVEFLAFEPFGSIWSGSDSASCSLKQSGRLVCVPTEFGERPQNRKGKVCVGGVNGRFRISEFLENSDDEDFVLRVWELNRDIKSWELVHNVCLKIESREVFVLAFHPSESDRIFMVRGNYIYIYKIGVEEEDKNYEKVGEIPKLDFPDFVKEDLGNYLNVFTLAHPSWPICL